MASRPLTCPFCGVLCDDLQLVAPDGAASSVMTQGCALAAEQFTAARQAASAAARAVPSSPDDAPRASWLEASRVTTDAAIFAVADRLARSHRPAIVCAACDVATARAASALASTLGAVLDDGASPGDRAARSATARVGLSTATLSELRNRADVVVLVGEAPLAGMPRLVERYLAPPPLLGRRPERRFVSIGPGDASLPSILGPVDPLPCQPAHLDATLGRLQHRLMQSSAKPKSATADAALETVIKTLLKADYAAWVWQPSRLGPDADLVVERLASILGVLNEHHHHVGVPLSAAAGGGTAAQVIAWQTGLAPPVTLDHLTPRHEEAAAQAADFRLWISPLSAVPPPAAHAPPTAILGHPATPPDAAPVVIPVGIPGVDHSGYVFTADGSEIRRLSHFLNRDLPSAESVLTRLRSALPTPPLSC